MDKMVAAWRYPDVDPDRGCISRRLWAKQGTPSIPQARSAALGVCGGGGQGSNKKGGETECQFLFCLSTSIITRCHTSSSTTKQANRESLPHEGRLMVGLLRNISLQERQKRVCLRRSRSKLIGPSGGCRSSGNRFGRVVCGKF